MAKKIKSYESALVELEQIVSALQNGNTTIDNLTQQVNRAAELMDFCKNKLRETETTVEQSLNQE